MKRLKKLDITKFGKETPLFIPIMTTIFLAILWVTPIILPMELNLINVYFSYIIVTILAIVMLWFNHTEQTISHKLMKRWAEQINFSHKLIDDKLKLIKEMKKIRR